MKEKLKPCPFCGTYPELEIYYPCGCSEYDEQTRIICRNTKCLINPSTGYIESFEWIEGPPHEYKRIDNGERTCNIWNKRTNK